MILQIRCRSSTTSCGIRKPVRLGVAGERLAQRANRAMPGDPPHSIGQLPADAMLPLIVILRRRDRSKSDRAGGEDGRERAAVMIFSTPVFFAFFVVYFGPTLPCRASTGEADHRRQLGVHARQIITLDPVYARRACSADDGRPQEIWTTMSERDRGLSAAVALNIALRLSRCLGPIPALTTAS